MTAPSRDTAGRRQRERRALARQLDDELGPDQSRIVARYVVPPWEDWTIRRVERAEDQRREGALLRNCLGGRGYDTNAWSLRDHQNLPHLCFAAWRIEPDDVLDEIPFECHLSGHGAFVGGRNGLLFIDLKPRRPVKARRFEQLKMFADGYHFADADRFPVDRSERIETLLPHFYLPVSRQRRDGLAIALRLWKSRAEPLELAA